MNQKLKTVPWDGSTLPTARNESLPYCDELFSYTITGDLESGFIIESVGKSGNVERRVTGLLELRGPFEYSLFSETGIDLASYSLVSWYNFDENDGNMKLATNNTVPDSIILRNSATIDGDVFVGMGADPDVVIDLKLGSTITGQTSAMREVNQLASVTVPQWLQSLPSGGTIKNNLTITTSKKYSGINLKNSKTITINGAVSLYITGDVILGNSAELQVVNTNPDASLILYLGGNFEGKNLSTFNNMTQDPKKLKIYGLDSCEQMLFKNSSDFYGAVYAPNADVIFDNSANAFGSVAAKSFVQRNSATFDYDASLRDVTVNDDAVRFIIQRWREE
jgi:hypothetical protein